MTTFHIDFAQGALCAIGLVMSAPCAFYFLSNTLMNDNKNGKITWGQIINAIIQAIVAAITALGVSSCMKL